MERMQVRSTGHPYVHMTLHEMHSTVLFNHLYGNLLFLSEEARGTKRKLEEDEDSTL